MRPHLIEEAANALVDAQRTGRFIAPLRETYAGLGIEDAYAIQRLNTERRLREGRGRSAARSA